jgi:serine/threonine protein kinase
LSHPNIPKAYDYFTQDGRQFFVMDYIEGINLEQLMQRRRPGTEEVLDWAMKLCDILLYLHSLTPPIIHSDVQPSNIILMSDGRICLVDFGFAKVYRPEGEKPATAKPSIRRPGNVEETEVFDPQMAHLAIPLITDRRSDQYSLAATVYCLLTGEPPLDSMERLAGKPKLASIRASRPDLSPSAEQVIFRALSLDQNRRYSDIEDFKAALRPEA